MIFLISVVLVVLTTEIVLRLPIKNLCLVLYNNLGEINNVLACKQTTDEKKQALLLQQAFIVFKITTKISLYCLFAMLPLFAIILIDFFFDFGLSQFFSSMEVIFFTFLASVFYLFGRSFR